MTSKCSPEVVQSTWYGKGSEYPREESYNTEVTESVCEWDKALDWLH